MNDSDGRLALDAWHRERGAEMGGRRGFVRPLRYGDPANELDLVESGCALIDRSDIARIELLGEDRARFLNGLVTCNVATLEPGRGSFGLLTSQKGRVLATLVVHALSDRLWLELPAGRRDAVIEHLGKYLVADRVEALPLDELLPLSLVGDRTGQLLAGWGAEVPSLPWGNRLVTILETQMQLSSHERLGVAGVTLWIPSSIAVDVLEELESTHGLRMVGFEVAEQLRIRAGIGSWGVDFDDRHLPQEIGAADAVDYTKGCYLGQEVVARLHYRGQAPRLLCQLEVEGRLEVEGGLEVEGAVAGGSGAETASGLELPIELLYEGRAAGELTSLSPLPDAESTRLGLAVLQRRACVVGSDLTAPDGVRARVVEVYEAG